MALAYKGRGGEHLRQWKEREMSPERTKVWTEPKARSGGERKVPVVYYLSRNGQLEHPHFMEVTPSSAEGLRLRDIINRMNFLRGKGMANLYSWSCKRSYKNGFVWHDLSEDDVIYPAHGQEYVLKGSELLGPAVTFSSSPTSQGTVGSSSGSEKPLEIPKEESDFALLARRKKKTPWNSMDLSEYKVYKAEVTAESGAKAAADASTQTDDRRHRRRPLPGGDGDRLHVPAVVDEDPAATELGRDEISPPPSSSSPETLESLIKADGRIIAVAPPDEGDRTVGPYPSGRMRASAVLMHLISCGSIAVKDHGFPSLVPQYSGRLARGRSDLGSKEIEGLMESASFTAIKMEDKEYFSGSLIETSKKECNAVADFPGLKRSNSYNADKGSKLELADREIDGIRAKCIPRRPRMSSMARKDSNPPISRSAHGSKRINDEPPEK